MPTTPHVAILLLNYNGRAYLEQFLPFLQSSTYPNKKIHVIDNGSTDDSLSFLATHYPDIAVAPNGQNLGYAAGYNQGVARIIAGLSVASKAPNPADPQPAADYFVFLNTDVEVSPGFLEPLIALLEGNPSIGICQPKINSLAQRDRFEYAGGAGGWIDTLGYTFARGRLFDHAEKDMGQYDDDAQIFWASGACMVMKASLFCELGGFYDYFFMYSEEVDLCWRAQIAGYTVAACGSSTVFHRQTSPLAASPRRAYFNFRNNLIMLARNEPAPRLFILLPVRFLLNALAFFQFLLQARGRTALNIASAHLGFLKWLFFIKKSPPSPIGSATPTANSVTPFSRTPKKIALSNLEPTYKGSVVLNYFLLHKKKFSQLIRPKSLPA